MMAEWLASEHVGQMHLDEGNADAEQGIAQCYAGVGECGGIDDDEGDVFRAGGVDAIDQFVFSVALETTQSVRPQLLSQFRTAAFDVSQGGSAINGGFASTQQVKIGAIQQQQFRHDSNSESPRGRARFCTNPHRLSSQ